MQEQPTHHPSSPDEPGTTAPAPSQENTPEAVTYEDEAGDPGQVPFIPRKLPEPAATSAVHQLGGIEESLRGRDGAFRNVQFQYSVRYDCARRFQEMVAQGQYARNPLLGVPFPSDRQDYGTTGELFARIKLAVAEQTQVSDANSSLQTYWLLSTWFQDILPVAPGLAITGWACEGDVVLRTLQAFCYHPILVAGVTSATLNDLYWDRKPTLLISDSSLTKRMAILLGNSTSPGYLTFRKIAGRPNYPYDYFSSKAVFLGEEQQVISALQNYLHVSAFPASRVKSTQPLPLSKEIIQVFQNMLLSYRIRSLPQVHSSDFYASGLSSGVTPIANALGRCIVGAPDLQADLVRLLMPYSDQQIAERVDDLGALAVGAALSLCHLGAPQILVGQIAAEVNRILEARGERLRVSPEKVGHKLKKTGLVSRRMGAAGNGFLMDSTTQALLHQVAIAYSCAGVIDNGANLHCQFCQQNT